MMDGPVCNRGVVVNNETHFEVQARHLPDVGGPKQNF